MKGITPSYTANYCGLAELSQIPAHHYEINTHLKLEELAADESSLPAGLT